MCCRVVDYIQMWKTFLILYDRNVPESRAFRLDISSHVPTINSKKCPIMFSCYNVVLYIFGAKLWISDDTFRDDCDVATILSMFLFSDADAWLDLLVYFRSFAWGLVVVQLFVIMTLLDASGMQPLEHLHSNGTHIHSHSHPKMHVVLIRMVLAPMPIRHGIFIRKTKNRWFFSLFHFGFTTCGLGIWCNSQ